LPERGAEVYIIVGSILSKDRIEGLERKRGGKRVMKRACLGGSHDAHYHSLTVDGGKTLREKGTPRGVTWKGKLKSSWGEGGKN